MSPPNTHKNLGKKKKNKKKKNQPKKSLICPLQIIKDADIINPVITGFDNNTVILPIPNNPFIKEKKKKDKKKQKQ